MRALLQIKPSLIAFLAALALGMLSMGALGALLYYACYPVLAPRFGDLNDWSGDWVWPAMIGVGMVWSFSFLVAGFVDLRLKWRGSALPLRSALYILILWSSAALIWSVALMAQDPSPTPAAPVQAALAGDFLPHD